MSPLAMPGSGQARSQGHNLGVTCGRPVSHRLLLHSMCVYRKLELGAEPGTAILNTGVPSSTLIAIPLTSEFFLLRIFKIIVYCEL